jgi:hypothetical protein
MFKRLPSAARARGVARALPTLLIFMTVLAASPALACNPFGGEAEPSPGELARANLGPPPVHDPPSQATATPQPAPLTPVLNEPDRDPNRDAAEPPAPSTSQVNSNGGAGSPPAQIGLGPTVKGDGDEARRRVWAFLSQCVAVGLSDLEAADIGGVWFVQDAGGEPDRYGIWKLDAGTGAVQPHSMRAREWAPRIGPACTREAFVEFYQPTPPAPSANAVTDSTQAVTALWATLVRCYPALKGEDLQATKNPANAQWIVTARPEITTSYGVWTVRGNGEVVPHNRQALGIHSQLDSGLC